MTKEEVAFCAEVEKNLADEAEAREGYYRFLELYGNQLSKDEQAEIDEIISEELKHTVILQKMLDKVSPIRAEKD